MLQTLPWSDHSKEVEAYLWSNHRNHQTEGEKTAAESVCISNLWCKGQAIALIRGKCLLKSNITGFDRGQAGAKG
jgi:hypothetical protein